MQNLSESKDLSLSFLETTASQTASPNDAQIEECRASESFKILTAHLIPSLVYVIILFIIGIPGNCLVCHVYLKKWRKRRKPSTLFIMALSWFDLMNNLVSLPSEIVILTNFVSFDYPFVCKFTRFITFFMNCASSIVLIGIVIDRFIGIWCSYKTKPFGIPRAKFVVVLAIIVSCLTCWPSILLYGTQTVPAGPNCPTLKMCLIDDAFVNTKYPFIYGMYLLGSNIIIDIVFIVLYLLIGIKIYRRGQFGSLSPKRSWSTVITFTRRPSMYSYSSTTNIDDDVIPLNSGKSNKFPFSAKLVRHESFSTEKSDLYPKYSRCSVNQSCESIHSKLSENNYHTLSKINEYREMTFKSLAHKRSKSLPECNLLSLGETKSRKCSRNDGIWKRQLSRQASFVSSQQLGDGTNMSRYGRTYHTGRTTFMLFLVTLAYILTFVPYCVIVIIRYTDPLFYYTQTDMQKNFYNLFLRSYLLSSAINPIIYNFTSYNFRQDCISIIKKLVCKLKF